MKTIKVVKSFEDTFISASKTGNMEWIEVTEDGRIKIFGLPHDDWPEGKEATEPDDNGIYKAGDYYIPGWALNDKIVEDIPKDIKAIYELTSAFDCNNIPCQECVFHDHTNHFCMLVHIRRQTNHKYPGPWK